MTKIAIIYYSMYGHVATMAEAVKKGIEAGGATCDIYQVAETLSEDILKAMGAPPKSDYPVITAAQMTEYDGFIFGISGRYGAMPAQMKVGFGTLRVFFFTTHIFTTQQILTYLYAHSLSIDFHGLYRLPLDERCPRRKVLWNVHLCRYHGRRTRNLQRFLLQLRSSPRHGLCPYGICGTQGLHL